MPGPSDEDRLAELLLAWEDRRRPGRADSAEELCRDCPELAAELARRIAALLALDGLIGDPDGPAPGGGPTAPEGPTR